MCFARKHLTSLTRVPCPCVSCRFQLVNSSDRRNVAAGKFAINISEILLQFLSRFALSSVVWILFQESKPHLVFLPVDVLCPLHSIVPPRLSSNLAQSQELKRQPVSEHCSPVRLMRSVKRPANSVTIKDYSPAAPIPCAPRCQTSNSYSALPGPLRPSPNCRAQQTLSPCRPSRHSLRPRSLCS